jgi:hypothetical protein
MIKKARTRLNFFLQVNERLPDKDFRIWNKEKHRRVELKTKNNKTSSMNTKQQSHFLFRDHQQYCV